VPLVLDFVKGRAWDLVVERRCCSRRIGKFGRGKAAAAANVDADEEQDAVACGQPRIVVEISVLALRGSLFEYARRKKRMQRSRGRESEKSFFLSLSLDCFLLNV